jgi:arylsulfatase A-like enzyme
VFAEARGQIAELANDWDGYMGVIPKTSATVAEVLKDYGYHTGAWGEWHNTPAEQTTAAAPFDYWPTGTQALYDEAKQQGWIIISMKNDWKRIFAFE